METNKTPVVDLFDEIRAFISKKGKKSPKEIAKLLRDLDKLEAEYKEFKKASEEAIKLRTGAKLYKIERIIRIILAGIENASG